MPKCARFGMFFGRGKLESLLLSETVHFPKLALVNLIGVACFRIKALLLNHLSRFRSGSKSYPLDVETTSSWQ